MVNILVLLDGLSGGQIHERMIAMSSKIAAAAALFVLAAAVPAAAATDFSASLTGSQQTIPNASTATGTGFATLSDDENTLTGTLTWAGLSAPASMGHIHCCAALGDDAPVALDFMPLAAASGSVTRSFDLTALSSYSSEFTAVYTTAAAARSAFVSGINSGLAYFNIHDVNYPEGEIRGQISSTGAVPEPASWALLIGGFALTGGAMRRRPAAAA